ncbi:MAG: sialic acid O-acetyltransferase, partial [Planctomyces sp.]
MNSLLIISAGNLGREVHNWANQAITAGLPWKIKGFLDNRRHALDGIANMPPILCSVEDYVIEENDIFLCAIGDPRVRQQYQTAMEQRGGRFGILIHPAAIVGHNVQI